MVNPLDLNLASRPIRNNTLLWVAHAALLLGVLGGTVWNVTGYVQHRRDLAVLNAERDSFDSRMSDLQRRENAARRGVAKHDLKDLTLRASKASDVIERKALSWTRLFNRMEEVLPYEVKMASIRPVFAFGRRSAAERERLPAGSVPVSVEGSAKTLQAFFEFERALIHDAHFDRVEPHRFNRTDGNEVVFEMRFLYYPDPAAEDTVPPETDRASGEPAPDEGAGEPTVAAAPEVEQTLPETEVEEVPAAIEVEEAWTGEPASETEGLTRVVVPRESPAAESPALKPGPGRKGRRPGERVKGRRAAPAPAEEEPPAETEEKPRPRFEGEDRQ
jgi:hypothetical protein